MPSRHGTERGSAEGAKYYSQGQARSASPLVMQEPRRRGLKGRNIHRLLRPFRAETLDCRLPGATRFALAPGFYMSRRWREATRQATLLYMSRRWREAIRQATLLYMSRRWREATRQATATLYVARWALLRALSVGDEVFHRIHDQLEAVFDFELAID